MNKTKTLHNNQNADHRKHILYNKNIEAVQFNSIKLLKTVQPT